MEKIEHIYLDIRDLRLHIAQIGKGELGTVVFLHGFPEIWYTWRHQMIAVAGAGFRAIAADIRGYGLSEQPPEPENAFWDDLLADLLAILDALAVPKEPGRAEADFGRFDVKRVVRTIYILFSRSEIPIAEEGQEILDLADDSTPLPAWFSEEDLDAYAALYEKSGFKYPLQMPYRALSRLQLAADPKVEVPALLIMGERDYCLKFPERENYIRSGAVKQFVPDLEITYIPEGSHFVPEQFPDQVNELIVGFLKSRSQSV
ncbi:AB hydrolase superfamily protein YfhM [Ananas comosus]|uniref:AB hydrolase superfamily protein YfhM n=1 Tax=Ananas comosus TaxID=4615 RepID=A0A199UD60_ANACO|nr:AB hydrolase superfamily protein YfhM [Ananas comosus]